MAEIKEATAQFCSVAACQVGLDPGGYGGFPYDHTLLIETPLPWPKGFLREAGSFPPEVIELARRLILERPDGAPVRHRFLALAPDAEYSRPGYRRLIYYRRPVGPFAAFTQVEYLVPEAKIGPLAWALLQEPAHLSAFDRYREMPARTRDLLVCTHGAVDAACGKFGYPLYRALRETYAAHSEGQLRAWRVSHFGGHIFAPTMLDMPGGRYWAFLDAEKVEQVVRRSGNPARLRGHYRGWSGLERPFLQVAERELFIELGWAWLDYLKSGQVLAQDEGRPNAHGGVARTWAEVRIDYASPDGRVRGAYEARVEVERKIEAIPSTGGSETHPYPQYVVTQARFVPADFYATMPDLAVHLL